MRLIKYNDKVRIKTSRDPDTGRVTGHHVEHKDGRVAGVAKPDVIRAKTER